MKHLKKFQWKKLIKWAVILLIIVIVGRFALKRVFASRQVINNNETAYTTAKVEKRDIETVLSSSGTVEPKNTYAVKTLAEGEIISADFEEGDIVKEGQVLYQISTDDLDSKLETAETAVTRAQKDYDKAKENYEKADENYQEAKADYEEAGTEYGNPNVAAEESGIVKTLFVKEGDKIQSGSQIAEIYDNSSMLFEVYFNASEVDQSMVGKKAEIIISDSFESLEGTITKVSNIEEVLSGNRLVNLVTIRVANPGGLTTSSTATAVIGDIYSSNEGTFRVSTETVITSEVTGKISSLKIEEGSMITSGDVILIMDQDSVEDQLETYTKELENAEDALENAKESTENAEEAIEDAQSALQEVKDSRADYSITAPVSGQIITKSALAGDTINFNSALCTIYDLSSVAFQMYIDELDVLSVKVGQEVNITADALEGVKLQGVVTNISLESTANQGVTQYPVTVMIDEPGDLLPGMNVTGEIILEKAEGVLAIPSDALMRGDLVYVADESVTEAQGEIPAGFRAVPVETGITDGDYVEVISGLTGEEEVYIVRATGTQEMINFMPGSTMMQRSEDFDFEIRDAGSNQTRPATDRSGGAWPRN
jgi:HlyD family secretion protein